jgi:hypothetical protein
MFALSFSKASIDRNSLEKDSASIKYSICLGQKFTDKVCGEMVRNQEIVELYNAGRKQIAAKEDRSIRSEFAAKAKMVKVGKAHGKYL